MDCSPPASSVHGDSPGKNTGVGCHALHQGIFPTQGLNPGLPHCRRLLYHLIISLIISNAEHPVPISPPYISFRKVSIQVFCPFFDWVVWVFFLYWVLWSMMFIDFGYWPLINYIICKYFHSVGFFVLPRPLLKHQKQKLLSLIRPHLFVFVFCISFALGDRSKYVCVCVCVCVCQRVFCLCSLLGVLWFQVLHLGL